jgi:hypothetical protein
LGDPLDDGKTDDPAELPVAETAGQAERLPGVVPEIVEKPVQARIIAREPTRNGKNRGRTATNGWQDGPRLATLPS